MNCKNQYPIPRDREMPVYHSAVPTNGIIGYDTPNQPGWYETEQVVDALSNYNSSIMQHAHLLADNGLVTKNGFIKTKGVHECASIIPGQAFHIDENEKKVIVTSVNLVNTINDGFRFVCTDENDRTADLGGLVTPVIVGNYEKPEAILIPLCNKKAYQDAMVFLDGIHYDQEEIKSYSDRDDFKMIK